MLIFMISQARPSEVTFVVLTFVATLAVGPLGNYVNTYAHVPSMR